MRSFRASLLVLLLAAATTLLVLSVRGQAGTPIALLVTGGTVVTVNASNDVIADGAVAIDHDKIVEVGPADALAAKYQPADRLEVRGQVVLPGLINGHTHAPMVLY